MSSTKKRSLFFETLFTYELAPFPASLIYEYVILTEDVEVEMVDGNMLLHHISWPKKGTVGRFCQNIADLDLLEQDYAIYVLFDKYMPTYIKLKFQS